MVPIKKPEYPGFFIGLLITKISYLAGAAGAGAGAGAGAAGAGAGA
jgi:hypothetical protein